MSCRQVLMLKRVAEGAHQERRFAHPAGRASTLEVSVLTGSVRGVMMLGGRVSAGSGVGGAGQPV